MKLWPFKQKKPRLNKRILVIDPDRTYMPELTAAIKGTGIKIRTSSLLIPIFPFRKEYDLVFIPGAYMDQIPAFRIQNGIFFSPVVLVKEPGIAVEDVVAETFDMITNGAVHVIFPPFKYDVILLLLDKYRSMETIPYF